MSTQSPAERQQQHARVDLGKEMEQALNKISLI